MLVVMLLALSLIKLVAEIALLALLGQGLLYLLAGAKREDNFFYGLLKLMSKPFTAVVRRATPAKVADRHVPLLTFGLLALVWLVVTIEKISLCGRIGVEHCK